VPEGQASGEYVSGRTSMIRREPAGVVGQIAPWNYPLMMAAWKIGPALAAGCTIVLKPAETTPITTVRLAEYAAEVLPKGVLNVITGHGQPAGSSLVTHPDIDMVSLTGSPETGKWIARSAADSLKRVHLELGGKAPVIVFDDVDMSTALETIAGTALYNAGQDCTAATRVLASERVESDLAAALVEQAGEVKLSKDEVDGSEDFFIPPLNNVNQMSRVTGLVERAPAHAKVLVGGERVTDDGYFYAPTVIEGVEEGDEMSETEIFGPVITVQRFSDEDEALRWANGTEYGLASSVWTSNHKRALRMARALDFGCVWVNCHIPLVAEMPHGGFKRSGYGKDLSSYSFEEYTRVKHVMSSIEG
jgi:betaine-aldehyde dehydrogenase